MRERERTKKLKNRREWLGKMKRVEGWGDKIKKENEGRRQVEVQEGKEMAKAEEYFANRREIKRGRVRDSVRDGVMDGARDGRKDGKIEG